MLSILDLAAFVGMTIIVTWSPLFERLRKRITMLECPMCVGFWIGLLGSVGRDGALRAPWLHPIHYFFIACIVSLAATITSFGLERLKP